MTGTTLPAPKPSDRREGAAQAECDNAPVAKTYAGIDQTLSDWMSDQPVFFVSTAPLDPQGSVNCSPKGNRDEFAVLDEHTVAFLDQTGSGVETIAHLRENGRIVIMFCAFAGPPRIVRLHGTGRAVLADDAGIRKTRRLFQTAAPASGSVRSSSSSCGGFRTRAATACP